MNENERDLNEELEELFISDELGDNADTETEADGLEEEIMISAEEREIDLDALTELIAARKYVDVREMLEPLPPIDIAELFCELDARYRAMLFRILPYAYTV